MPKVFKKWTEEEIELLKEHSLRDKDYLISLFPDRSWKSIEHKINNLGLPRKRQYYRFTKAETNLLKESHSLPKDELLQLFPNRSWESLIQKMTLLGLDWDKSWRLWSDEEIKILYKYDSIRDMSNHLDRTESQIYHKAKSLGIKFNDYWTNEEIKTLKDNYSSKPVEIVMDLLPNRNRRAIYIKAHELGLVSFRYNNKIKDEKVIELFNDEKYPAEIARILHCTITTVTNALKRNGVQFEQTFFSGEMASNWRGGITPENQKIRNSEKYRAWRLKVFERDNYACQCCGDDSGGNLHAHHIENFSSNKEKRFDVDNGITLCDRCHNPSIEGSFHHTYGTRNNNLEQLQEYIANYQSSNFVKM